MATNLPPYLTSQNINEIFGKFGDVVDLKISATPIPDTELATRASATELFQFKIAYVFYKSYKGVAQVLSATQPLTPLQDLDTFSTGLSCWQQEYEDAIQDEDQLQADIDGYMASFEANETAGKAQSEEADDDGWVTVTKDTTKGFQQNEAVVNRIEDKLEKQKKKKELNNFYTFQIRESKKKDIISLRAKFTQDQKKMEAIKKSRKYTPY
jgi:ribosomal RNA-processing protein 7